MGNGLTFAALRKTNVARCEKAFHALTAWSAQDWACALAGEVGKACNIVKKMRRGDAGPDARRDLGSELADTIIYADLLAAREGIDLEAAVIAKFNEVSRRRNCDIFLGEGEGAGAGEGAGDGSFTAGQIVRTGEGPTALMRIEHVSSRHGGPLARYYGQHCLGHIVGAYHNNCSRPNAEDMETWRRHNPPEGKGTGKKKAKRGKGKA